MGLILGWLDGAAKIGGLSDGIEDGLADSGLQRSFGKMCLAASSAGMGFGNAGVHLCHGMSYAVASQVKGGYRTEGYPKLLDGKEEDNHGLVAHGLLVAMNASLVFLSTVMPDQITDPSADRYSKNQHLECAMILANAWADQW